MLPVVRQHPGGALRGLYNVTASWRRWPGDRLVGLGLADTVDALTGEPARLGDDGNLWLRPYGAAWLVRAG